ncbi:protein adenylyltransferase SelO family protein [Vibrio sinaloensis]|nr:protein adenylyltransferase SelO family protein [Vibrio sinaloensis]
MFGRRARVNEHPEAMAELEAMALHVIEREYRQQIDAKLPLADQLLLLAREFRERLTDLVTNWLRVGYCQGNFNSDNCALGGFTLDYGPFGFFASTSSLTSNLGQEEDVILRSLTSQ